MGAILLLGSCSGGVLSELESELEEVAREYDCVGMSVAAVKDGEIVWLGDFGVKNLESGEPVGRSTLYRIASISKSFAATAMMQLVDRGLITLDTDVSTVAGFPVRNPKYPDTPITLEMLMCHLSSIDDFGGYTSMDFLNPEVNPEWQSCYLDCEPGTEFHYCEFNYGIVAALLEKLTGERFDEYIKEHIFDALHIDGGYIPDSLDSRRFASLYNVSGSDGSNGSGSDGEDGDAVEKQPETSNTGERPEAAVHQTEAAEAQPEVSNTGKQLEAYSAGKQTGGSTVLDKYRHGAITAVERPEAYASRSDVLDSYRLGVSAPGVCPSSGIKISAEGLATYMLMHMNRGWSPTAECRILSEESALAMQASHTGDEGYGLALGRTAEFIPGIETVGHTGGAYGLRSVMCWTRDADFGVVMICSGSREPLPDEPTLFEAIIQPIYRALMK